MKRKVLVIGASENPERYSNKAITLLNEKGYEVLAIGLREGHVNNIPIMSEQMFLENIDTVTVYLNSHRQRDYYKYLINLKPKRVIFNPGAENAELKELLQIDGIEVMEACTLVLLHTKQF